MQVACCTNDPVAYAGIATPHSTCRPAKPPATSSSYYVASRRLLVEDSGFSSCYKKKSTPTPFLTINPVPLQILTICRLTLQLLSPSRFGDDTHTDHLSFANPFIGYCFIKCTSPPDLTSRRPSFINPPKSTFRLLQHCRVHSKFIGHD
ncbi:hypothetical protein COCMIDRAFT_99839 [Bipolaris oryzae ATCC 44560]|uniref:Uncharacterized protein n=1 Tax=Bipolaris oryzae ATCC 44560 TaxID=930090 RepID=W6YWT0_COCMI|nr:uncharacterized protein COCMIDRAFT_99839 [Bipolaris oryzae ATCC 44560]EUC43842.1 hypothetical protein COCMIDRAFT_99839 [Bipolaris oryzae ATCC 44560]